MRREFKNKRELDAFIATGAIQGRAMHMLVLHDDACTPSACVCEPEFVLEDLTAETYAAGQRKQDGWIKETTS